MYMAGAGAVLPISAAVSTGPRFSHDVSMSIRQAGSCGWRHPVSRSNGIRSPFIGPSHNKSDPSVSRLACGRRSIKIQATTSFERLERVQDKERRTNGNSTDPLNEERKKIEVPVIDIGSLFGEEGEERQRVLHKVKAAAQFGYFFIVNHGIDAQLLDNLRKTAAKFFELPLDEKKQSASMDAAKPLIVGYGIQNAAPTVKRPITVRRETYITKATYLPSSLNHSCWPATPPKFKDVLQTYEKELLQLQLRLLNVLAEGLGLSPTYMSDMLPDPRVKMTTSRWRDISSKEKRSSGPGDEGWIGEMHAHTDVTLLVVSVQNEVDGVNCYTQGQWVRCEYPEDEYPGAALLVMVGEWMEVLSNGIYHSPVHRVTSHPTKFRITTVGSIDGPPGFVVGPAPELIDDGAGKPAAYKTISCKERMLHIKGSNKNNDYARFSKSSLRTRPSDLDASRDIVVAADGQALLGGRPADQH